MVGCPIECASCKNCHGGRLRLGVRFRHALRSRVVETRFLLYLCHVPLTSQWAIEPFLPSFDVKILVSYKKCCIIQKRRITIHYSSHSSSLELGLLPFLPRAFSFSPSLSHHAFRLATEGGCRVRRIT